MGCTELEKKQRKKLWQYFHTFGPTTEGFKHWFWFSFERRRCFHLVAVLFGTCAWSACG